MAKKPINENIVIIDVDNTKKISYIFVVYDIKYFKLLDY